MLELGCLSVCRSVCIFEYIFFKWDRIKKRKLKRGEYAYNFNL